MAVEFKERVKNLYYTFHKKGLNKKSATEKAIAQAKSEFRKRRADAREKRHAKEDQRLQLKRDRKEKAIAREREVGDAASKFKRSTIHRLLDTPTKNLQTELADLKDLQTGAVLVGAGAVFLFLATKLRKILWSRTGIISE